MKLAVMDMLIARYQIFREDGKVFAGGLLIARVKQEDSYKKPQYSIARPISMLDYVSFYCYLL